MKSGGRRRAGLCLGVKSIHALPSRSSLLHPVVCQTGLHSKCTHQQKSEKYQEVVPSPASRIVGRFQDLKHLSAEIYDLCEYIDIVQGKHDRLLVVSEHYRSNLAKEIQNYKRNGLFFEEPTIRKWTFRVLRSLAYLNGMGIVHRNLSPECLLLDGERDIKMADYGRW